MRHRGRYSGVIGICMVLAALGAPLQAQQISWAPGDPPKDGRIISPKENGVYACGADVLCVCLPAYDWDDKTVNGPCPVTTKELDAEADGYPLWTVSGGGYWKDGDNIGVSAVWIAPNEPASGISFRMYDEDRPYPVYPPETGTRDDIRPPGSQGFLQDTKTGIRAIKPVVDMVLYSILGQGAKMSIHDVNTPEYDRAKGRNEPAAWVKGSQTLAIVKFWHELQLSQAVEVNVCALTYGDGDNIIFWTECGPVMWTTTWEASGGFNCPALAKTKDSIESHDYFTVWLYQCPNGSKAYLVSDVIYDCNLYGVYDAPSCPENDYVKKNIRWACGKAHDANTIIGIADKIHTALAGDPPMEPGECEPNEVCWDWRLLDGCPYYGACNHQAAFMVSVLQLLGVTGAHTNQVHASQDAGVGHCIALDDRWENDEHQWLIMDFDESEEHAPNAFEGTAVVFDESLEDFWYAVWPSYKATDDYDMLLKLPCEQWWVTTYNDIPPGTSREWYVTEWCEQIAKPR
jgi:hypothetical protein